MTPRHLFTFRIRDAEGMTLKELVEDGRAIFKLTAEIDEWITENDLRDQVEYQPPRHKITTNMIAFEAPSWDFGDENDALLFKLIFGDRFEYSVYDAE